MCGGLAENAELCRYGARVFSSREMTAEEVMKTVLLDRPFYENGGGVTFSGGEPCCQPDFLMELLELCRKEKVSAAIETNLNYPSELLQKILPSLDLLMVDLKIMDSERHQLFTGFPDNRILTNIELLQNTDIPVIVRTPLVAGVNDDDTNMEQSIALLKKMNSLKYYELLRYHPLGMEKFKGLGWEFPVFEAPSEKRLTALCKKIQGSGIRLYLDGKEL